MDNLYINNWDEYFLRHAYLTSYKSKDKFTKIGSVIVKKDSIISEGFNGLPRKVNDEINERHERPEKYAYYEHSERNAIFNCARNGQSSLGCYLYSLALPCCDCSRACIQAGIFRIYIHRQYQKYFNYHENWKKNLRYSEEMLHEAGIEIIEIDKILGLKALCNSETIEV